MEYILHLHEVYLIAYYNNAKLIYSWKTHYAFVEIWYSKVPFHIELEQLERLRSEDTPRRPMISHTIDQFILNPKSILLTSSYRIPSQNKVKAKKFAQKLKF